MTIRSHKALTVLIPVALAIAVGAIIYAFAVYPAKSAPNTTRRSPAVQAVPWSWTNQLQFYDPPAPLPADPHGTLIRVQRLAPDVRIPSAAIGYRMLYTSLSLQNTEVAVSGFVVLPRGTPPAGGWPVIDWAHATDGLAPICAPSRYQFLEVPYLDWFVQHGYAVVGTDYQSIGTPGVNPYLVGRVEGMNVLDAALAARELPGYNISSRTLLLGYSQGGQSALFAAQMAAQYAPGLDALGVAAEAPAVGLVNTLTNVLKNNTLNGLFVTLAFSWSHTYADLPLSRLLAPRARSKMLLGSLFTECQNGIDATYQTIPAGLLAAPGIMSNRTFIAHLRENDPGNSRTSMPILLAYGKRDIIIPTSAYQSFTRKACANGSTRVSTFISANAGHGTILQAATGTVEKWISNRFAGKPAPSNCSPGSG
ncbi:MAG: lipase family protein [Acidimicrobiales bacterium]